MSVYSKSLNQTGILSQERDFVLASTGTSEMKSHKFHADGGLMLAFIKQSKTTLLGKSLRTES